MKILILKPSSLGDVIHALPVLRMIRLHNPDAQIHWWINRGLMPLLQNDPDIHTLVPFDRKGWESVTAWVRLVRMLHQLRKERFDLVLDLQGLLRSSLIGWFTRGQLTIGLDDHREGARAFHDITIQRPSSKLHAVDYNLEILKPLKIPARWDFDWLPVNNDASRSVKRHLSSDHRLVLLQPGARWPTKRWPARHFSDLANQLTFSFPNLQFAVVGDKSERELAEEVCAGIRTKTINLAGQTSIPELIEWIRHARLLITNDTGPMHIAAAIGCPTLAVFGPTNPELTGPYGQFQNVVSAALDCAPCMSGVCRNKNPLLCLTGISPSLMAEKSRAFLS